jgi:hypothetical protein
MGARPKSVSRLRKSVQVLWVSAAGLAPMPGEVVTEFQSGLLRADGVLALRR